MMPAKTEHVLFCRLSETQRALYEAYLRSDDVAKVMRGSANLLGAITMVSCRKPTVEHGYSCLSPNSSRFDQNSFEKFATTLIWSVIQSQLIVL